MATPTNSLAPLLATAAARIGTARGRAMILAEGVVADVGEITTGDKGQRKRMVTIAYSEAHANRRSSEAS